MPELPEVETVRRGLAPSMEDATIAHVAVNRPDLRWPFPEDMAKRLTGKSVLSLRRRSKYILCDLSSGETLLIHLGMSGTILVTGDPMRQFSPNHPAPKKHDHVVIDMNNGARITFNDPRRFGAMDLFTTAAADSQKLLASLGPEPLGNKFDESYLIDALNRKKAPIKSALLDQRIIAGLGNIYVCETLYRAGISPKRPSGEISSNKVGALVPIIRNVLQEAIDAGGSSLKDFRQAGGDLGYFQHRFAVYDREGAPCPTKGCTGIIMRITQSGRSSFYCAQCQR